MAFKKFPYTRDFDNYGKSDDWATPLEFFAHGGGDCDCYAVSKYVTLRELGFPADSLRLVLVRPVRGDVHAILAVYMENDILILDNCYEDIRSHTAFKELYRPEVSMNEKHAWNHVPF